MGAGASSQQHKIRTGADAPYANEADALADGKTQDEIDLWKSSNLSNPGAFGDVLQATLKLHPPGGQITVVDAAVEASVRYVEARGWPVLEIHRREEAAAARAREEAERRRQREAAAAEQYQREIEAKEEEAASRRGA
jgi:hypothetical protein